MEEVPSGETQAAFERVSGVDEGEAVLYGILPEREFHLLASNDKTAMRAVATNVQLAKIRGLIAGRVVQHFAFDRLFMLAPSAGRKQIQARVKSGQDGFDFGVYPGVFVRIPLWIWRREGDSNPRYGF